jgi:orotate phosphoribosyltransferase
MKEAEVRKILANRNAIITDSHIVYTSGKHGSAYINKDAVYPFTADISRLCRGIAEEFMNSDIQAVVGPVVGGVALCQWVASHLSELTGQEILAIYADKEESKWALLCEILFPWVGNLLKLEKTSFVLKRGHDKLVTGKNVLVVEDILNTGGSARKVVNAVRAAQGNVIGVGVLCNRGGVTPEDLGNIPHLSALLNVRLEAWDEQKCPLCRDGKPINTEVGKGKEFISRYR